MLELQLRYYVVEFGCLTGNAGESELRFGVGEPEARPIGSESREAHCWPVEPSYLRAVRSFLRVHFCVGCSPMWDATRYV